MRKLFITAVGLTLFTAITSIPATAAEVCTSQAWGPPWYSSLHIKGNMMVALSGNSEGFGHFHVPKNIPIHKGSLRFTVDSGGIYDLHRKDSAFVGTFRSPGHPQRSRSHIVFDCKG